MQVQQFLNHISGVNCLYGLQKKETLDSLVLSVLPPNDHTFQSFDNPSIVDSDEDVKVFCMKELLQALRHSAGFQIPIVSIRHKIIAQLQTKLVTSSLYYVHPLLCIDLHSF